MSALELLSSDGFIVVNKRLIKELGLQEAVLFGVLCSEYNLWKTQDKLYYDMFYIPINRLEDLTGLSYYKQQKAINKLEDEGFITTTVEGVPSTRYFKINENIVFEKLKLYCLSSSNIGFEKLKSSNIYNNTIINNNTDNNYNNSESYVNHTNDVLENLKKDISQEHKTATSSNQTIAKRNTFLNSLPKDKKKEPKENRFKQCVNVIDEYFPKDKELKDILVIYLKMLFEGTHYSNGTRISAKRELYVNQWRGKLVKLQQLVMSGENAIECVQNSLDKGYQSFYPPNKKFKADNVYTRAKEQGIIFDNTDEQIKDANENDISQQITTKRY